jgi:hypothetical protein
MNTKKKNMFLFCVFLLVILTLYFVTIVKMS